MPLDPSSPSPVDKSERTLGASRLYAFLSDITHAVVHIRDKQSLFEETCRIAVERGKFTFAWIGFVEEGSHLVKPIAFAGNEAGYLKNLKVSVLPEIKKGQGPTGISIRTGEPILCNDIGTDPMMVPWRDEALKRGYRSSGAFPIKRNGKFVGTINVYSTETNFFDEDEASLMLKIAGDLSYAIEFFEKEEGKREAERKLRESEERFRLAIRGSYAGIWDMDVAKNEIYYSPQWKELFGYGEDEVINTLDTWEEMIHPEDRDATLAIIHHHWKEQTPFYNSEHRLRCKNGEYKWVLSRGAAIWDKKGAVVRMAGSTTDIHEKKLFEEKLKEQEEFLSKIINTSPNFIIVKNREGNVILANQTVSDFCGKSIEGIISTKFEMPFHADSAKLEKIRKEEETIFQAGQPIFLPEVKYIDHKNNVRWFQTSKTPLFAADGSVKEILILSTEISRHKEAEEVIKFHAYHDPLTGLSNRLLFEDRLRLATFQAERSGGIFGIMYLDLDCFKPINDNYGHDVGDEVLKEVAQRLLASVRKSDTVARLGGDEFTVLVTDLKGREDAAKIAEKILESVRQPIQALGHECRISASIGISFYPQDGLEKVALLKKADDVLLCVKKGGKNNFRFSS